MSDLFARLKETTAETHRAVEDVTRLGDPSMRRERYQRLVERFYGFLVVWDPAAAAVVPAEHRAFFDERRKIAKLESDLAALGLTEAEIAGLPRAGDEARPKTFAEVLGGMYVFEGATLGGQYIARNVEKNLGMSEGRGYSFFRSYGDDVGRMWKAFKETVDEMAPAAMHDEIVAAANRTFEAFHGWLKRSDARSTTESV
jgi:heme oxygenase